MLPAGSLNPETYLCTLIPPAFRFYLNVFGQEAEDRVHAKCCCMIETRKTTKQPVRLNANMVYGAPTIPEHREPCLC